MAVHLITGFKGEEHIQSADHGSFNASFFGEGEFVMEAGNQCEASILDNNTVRVLDGDILMHGRHIRIPSNTYIDVTIQTGTAGVNRNDLIVMEYSKDAGTGVETADLKVIHGVAAEGTASDPAYTSGDILAGATFNQMPMYRVKVEGVVLTAVEPMFSVIPTYKKLAEQYAKQFQEACNTYLGALNILDSKEEIEANTQENQLAGALALKEVIAAMKSSITTQYDEDTDELQFKTLSDGQWHYFASGGLSTQYLYNSGDKFISVTGGWVSGKGNAGTVTDNDTNLYGKSAGQSASKSWWQTNNVIDVTKYNKVILNLTTTASNTSNTVELYNTYDETLIGTIERGHEGIIEFDIENINFIQPKILASSSGSNSTVEFYLYECYLKKQ